MADLLTKVKALDPAPEESELPVGMHPASVVLRHLDERTKTMQTQDQKTQKLEVTPRRPRWNPLWVAAAAFIAVLALGLLIVLVPGGEEPGPSTTVTTQPPTTTAAVEVEVELVMQSIAAWNSGDFDAWMEYYAPSDDDRLLDRIFMNANEVITVTSPCQIVARDASATTVECAVLVEDDFHGAGGLSSDGMMTFVIDETGLIAEDESTTYENDDGTCCPAIMDFHIAFHVWLREAHRDVYDVIGPSPPVNWMPPGLDTDDPEHMRIALEYVQEFVDQSDVYPLADGRI